MHRRFVIALVGAIVMAVTGSGVALAAASGPSVTVTVKNGNKTLTQSVVRAEKGWITKDGTPHGKCSGNSAAGALDAATHGKWTAKYYSQYGDVLVTSIDGVKPKGNDYWGFYVNGKTATVGVCSVKLHSGEKLLFKVVK